MNQQRAIPILIGVLAVAIIGFGIVSAIRTIRPATPVRTPTPVATPKPITLLDYVDSDDAVVRYTTLGRIVAKEHHIDQFLSVSRTRRTFDITRAYTGTTELGREFDNNSPAFEEFMRALSNAGFTATKNPVKTPVPKTPVPTPAESEVGLCPNGERYIYELIVGGSTISRAWSSSCGDLTTFGGNPSAIRALFQSQIPEYSKLASTVRP